MMEQNIDRPPQTVEAALSDELTALQGRAMDAWAGREAEALIILIRALDSVAIASKFDADGGKNTPIERINGRHFVRMGAASALRPFLTGVKDRLDGVPWAPMRARDMEFAYSYLRSCGQVLHLIRLARLEKYGLSITTMHGREAKIATNHSVPEMAAQFAMANARIGMRESAKPFSPRRGWSRLRHRMRQYVASDNGWFIRYENDGEIVDAYRSAAHEYGVGFLEGEALPDESQVGGRTFGEWKTACHQALGRILAHIDFCKLLRFKESQVVLGNVATIFARREDVEAVWREAGLAAEQVGPTMDALTLSVDTLDDWERSFELPCHFYVDFGRDFVLLPCFGALTNPYVALFRHLRSVYRIDWDGCVDLREAAFRNELARLFDAPRFKVPANGFKLRRSDGSVLTDIDAVVVDSDSGSVALIQLKWHDIFGYSLSERESRRKNLLAANRWVDRVTEWVAGRSSGEIARDLGIGCKNIECNAPPLLYVMSRYAARFSGEHSQDERASWLSWFEIVHVLGSCGSGDPLRELPQQVRRHEDSVRTDESWTARFEFKSLRVDLSVLP